MILACQSLFACGLHVRDALIRRLYVCHCARCRLRTNNFVLAVSLRRPLYFDTLPQEAATVWPLWIDFESRAYLRPLLLTYGWRRRGVTSVPFVSHVNANKIRAEQRPTCFRRPGINSAAISERFVRPHFRRPAPRAGEDSMRVFRTSSLQSKSAPGRFRAPVAETSDTFSPNCY